MSKTMKRSIAMLLVWLQIVLLLTAALPRVLAADAPAQSAPTALPDAAAMGAQEQELPALNEVIEGTVQFGSFNYTGDKGTDAAGDERDGVDYVTTFYYSDDYFSRSAVNPNASRKTMDWTDLEDLSMATLSMDFTFAVYGSCENTFPTDWSNKNKNGEKFLRECGFGNIFTNAEFNQQTGRDTLGYMFGSKQITVYDQKTHQNKTFTLVAVGVRGAGYGAEWASNLTIGNKNGAAGQNSSNSLKYRHYGFDFGAQKVLGDLKNYTQNMTGDVKYWVVGYSRSGAVANLVAGDITRQASTYHTSIDDVYGYTFEPAAGALTTEDPNGTTYPNIHNIINPMDAVPRVSTDLFAHGRLGVDYRVPFHGNTTAADNTGYYDNMRAALSKVSVIAELYDRRYSGRESDKYEDPVITDSDPANYPYNRTIQMKSFGIMNFSTGFVDDVSNSKIAPSQGWYLDQFLDSFVKKFFGSRAWDARKIKPGVLWNTYSAADMKRDDHASHEFEYVKYYQEALRTLAYEALKNPGMGLGALDSMMDKAMGAIDFRSLIDGFGLGSWYLAMDTTRGGTGYETSVQHLVGPLTNLLNRIVDELNLFEPSALDDVHSAIETIIPVLTWLYCDDHTFSNGEYLGTVFAYIGTILTTHNPEMGVAWLMSLDDVFTCDYREITLPKATDIRMLEFRAGFGDEANYASTVAGRAPVVAEFRSGTEITNLDDRISCTSDGDTVVIRYPGNLDIRFDVQTLEGGSFSDIPVQVADFAPNSVVNAYSTCTRADAAAAAADAKLNESNITSVKVERDSIGSCSLTHQDNTGSAAALNKQSDTTTIPMSDKDVLQVLAKPGSNQRNRQQDVSYEISKSVYVNVVVEGQLREDPDGTSVFLTTLMDESGFYKDGKGMTPAAVEAQVTYDTLVGASTAAKNVQLGRYATANMPVVGAGNTVGWYKITTDDTRLTDDGTTAVPDGFTKGALPAVGLQNYDAAATLTMTDQVWHVIYTGDVYYPAESKVVDFGTPTLMTTGVAKEVDDTANAGGTFDKTDADALTFTPAQTTGTDAYDVSAFSGVNRDYFYTQKNTADIWRQMNAVPASNIYFNDPTSTDLTDHTQTTVLKSSKGADGKVDKTSFLDITFFGTAIDAYCTCDKNAGWVRAEILKDGAPVDGVKAKLMGNAYDDGADGALYNAPTIHFEGLSADTYTLRITAAYGRDYHLDGVRVYNTEADASVEALRAKDSDGGARYVNVRDMLLESTELTDATDKEGAAFFVMGDNGASFETYKTEGPKREVYLVQDGQGVAFRVSNPGEVNVAVGLRCADAASGTAKINGADVPVNGTDTYYTVTPQNAKVTIAYGGSGKIAVTCIKLTDKAGTKLGAAHALILAPADLQEFLNDLLSQPDTAKAVWAAEAGDFSALLKLLLSSLETLFAGLGKW